VSCLLVTFTNDIMTISNLSDTKSFDKRPTALRKSDHRGGGTTGFNVIIEMRDLELS